MTRIGVVTIVSGRHDHLRAQQASLAASGRLPDVVVVVSLGDPDVRPVVEEGPLASIAGVQLHTVDVSVPDPSALPLSRARNAGAARALACGADLLVFLDVDCLAAPELVATYVSASERLAGPSPVVLGGPVGYLPEIEPGSTYDDATLAATPAHPARPDPPIGGLERAEDIRLFWSLSFAVSAHDWALLGGFDEAYSGYGGEDTDFGQRLSAAGGHLWWVGGARAHHQWHPVSSPPVEHLEAIVANANRFHRRWGWFPMEGWLAEFDRRGLARYEAGPDVWAVAARR